MRFFSACAVVAACVLGSSAAFAQCNCPAPRPMKATATSGVLKIGHSEPFEAIKRSPNRMEVIILGPGSGLTGAVRRIAEEIERSMRARARNDGFTGAMDFNTLPASSTNLTGSGFQFLETRTGKDDSGKPVSVGVYRRMSYTGGEPPKGKFIATLWVRAKVCVERGETHLSFDPETKFDLHTDLPNGANIPQKTLDARYAAFRNKLQAEANRIERDLQNARVNLSSGDRRKIEEASVQYFTVDADVRVFGKPHELPVRVTPFAKPRVCGPAFGDKK